ncbi:MAG: PhnD/SsuA/transferrin family substrate-binding protein [Desulfuromonas sp.]|nr:PhnD/SsuA/transferrin family substrate-binding protein [Desulfuromonas sp.]
MPYRKSYFLRWIMLIYAAVFGCLLSAAPVFAQSDPVKIGVLAKRGTAYALRQWQPSAEYLGQMIPQHKFTVVALSFDQVRDAVAAKNIDFLLVNPAIYVEMELDFNICRIATMKNMRQEKSYTYYGGVVFSRADHHIDSLAQLYDKTCMAVDPTSFGGAIVAWREMLEHDFDPNKDFSSLQYGKTHDAVVLAVRDGLVDVGVVRTDTLERMAAEGEIALADYQITPLWHGAKRNSDFPFLCSTRLYPEWPIAMLNHVPEELAKQVTIALLALEPTHPAAQIGKLEGWTIPHNYRSVHECLKSLHLGPYSNPPQLSFAELFAQYWLEIVLLLTLLIISTCYMVYFRILGQRLKESEVVVKDAHAELEQLFQSSADGILRVDTDFNVVRVNRTFETMTGLAAQDVIGCKCYDVFPGSACGNAQCPLQRISAGQSKIQDENVKFTKNGEDIYCLMFAVPFFDQDGDVVGVVEYYRDVNVLKRTEAELHQSRDALNIAYKELQLSQSQMLQQEKMASIGQLAAGVAHEINNPLGFIGSNLATLDKYWQRMRKFVDLNAQQLESGEVTVEELDTARRELKIDFMLEDASDLIAESLDGVERVKTIVSNLKSFSRLDQAKYDLIDINNCIDSTLTIVWNELKYHVTLQKDYADLPLTYCYPQQLNQVFMNLLVNAGHAIEGNGEINIATRSEDEQIFITISDNGCGISEENISHLFEPFFTTKEVGKGTGLGLSIAYDIIKNHNGKILVDSQLGQGTTFTIVLPIIDSPQQ